MNTRLLIVLPALLITFCWTGAGAEDRTTIATDGANIHLRGNFSGLHRKLNVEKRAHIGFIGGSITENRGGHTAMVPAWFREQYPDVEFTFTNAGISSTCSTSGAFRLEEDLLSKGKLDLVVVEFAVNDDQDAGHSHNHCIRGMEGIIRRLRRHNPRAAIVMVHFVNPGMLAKLQEGETPTSIGAHHKVAAHYDVTEINLAAEVAAATKSGKYTWSDYGGTHPKRFGYKIASDMITTAVKTQLADSQPTPSAAVLPKPIDAFNYGGGRMIPVANATVTGSWKRGKVSRDLLPLGAIRGRFANYEVLRGSTPGDTVKLEFTGHTVGAFVLAGPDAGIVKSRIDGGAAATHDLFHRFSTGLNYPRSVIFASELAQGKHTLELTIAPKANPASKGNAVNILFFEVSE